MTYLQLKFPTLLAALFVTALLCQQNGYSQSGLNGRHVRSLTKQHKSTIKDAASSRDLDKLRNVVREQPHLAESIAELYTKHSGVTGQEAGETAAMIAGLTNPELDGASKLASAVYRRKSSTLKDAAEIADRIAQAMEINKKLDQFSIFIGLFADELDLNGEETGELAAIVIQNHEYRGYSAGKVAGTMARGIQASEEELEDIVSMVLSQLKPDPAETDEFVSTVSLETGKEILIGRN